MPASLAPTSQQTTACSRARWPRWGRTLWLSLDPTVKWPEWPEHPSAAGSGSGVLMAGRGGRWVLLCVLVEENKQPSQILGLEARPMRALSLPLSSPTNQNFSQHVHRRARAERELSAPATRTHAHARRSGKGRAYRPHQLVLSARLQGACLTRFRCSRSFAQWRS